MKAAKGGINDWMALGLVKNEFTLIEKIVSIEKVVSLPQDELIGYGRIVTLKEPLNLSILIDNIKQSLGIKNLQIASPFGDPSHYNYVKKIALCAGSGRGVFKAIPDWEDIDVFYTGEMSHHELLQIKEMGKTCIASEADQDPLRTI